MTRIIAIETSSGVCSAALAVDGQCVALRENIGNQYTHSLTVYIQELLQRSGLNFERDIDAVAVSAGPGSYTGLRIGVSTAKGLCFASGKPLIAVTTTDALCAEAMSVSQGSIDENTRLVAMIDARRMEVYTASYDAHAVCISPPEAMVVDETSFDHYKNHKMILFGSGAQKCAAMLGASTLDVELSARWLCQSAHEKFLKHDFQDTAYFEPMYIKEFIALTSTKSLF